MNEPSLIEHLQRGDKTAFRELVDQRRNQVYNLALGFVQSSEDAEDICQEVFIEIFQSVGNFRGDSSLMTWIYRITVQKSLMHLRRKIRKKRSGILISLFSRESMTVASDPSPFYHPGVSLENKERSAILFRAIGMLPEKQRTAFTLHKLELLSYAEISEIMKTSLSSVESLMVRAKQNLQKYLEVYYAKNEK